MATQQPVKPSNFTPAGQGRLFFVTRAQGNVALWAGPLVFNDGTQARIEAKVITENDKPHFECEVKRIGKPGEGWRTIGEFRMRSFGGKANASQDVVIKSKDKKPKVIAKAKAWVRQTEDAEGNVGQFIKFQLLDAPKPKAMVP